MSIEALPLEQDLVVILAADVDGCSRLMHDDRAAAAPHEDAALFSAYLDRFPGGESLIIAEIRPKALRGP